VRLAEWLALLLAGLSLALWLTGCVGLADAIREAEDKQGNLCVSYIGPWGTVQLSKSNQGAGTLRCRPDGHTFNDPE